MTTHVTLNLYRRHKRDCSAGHPEQLRSGETDERRKGWKRCACPIVASGTLNRKFSRKSTGQTEWDQAREVTAVWTSWEEEPLPPAPAPEPDLQRITIEQAVKLYRADLTSHAISTLRGYRYLIDDMMAFSLGRGYVYVDQWRPIDVREFRASWLRDDDAPVKISTATKNMATVKAFFRFVESNGWVQSNPTRLIKDKRTRQEREAENLPRIPFTDEEMERMYWLCEHKYATVGDYNRVCTGQDLADFIGLSASTGLRISDVRLFRADSLQPGGVCRLRATKNGTWVSTLIPEWLQARIEERARKYGMFVFGALPPGVSLEHLTDVWRRRLNKLWALEGWEVKPVHHRFRHTFARVLLQKGMSMADVATLLGDTEQVVRKHYAQWVPEHQERLLGALRVALADQPKPGNVVAFLRA